MRRLLVISLVAVGCGHVPAETGGDSGVPPVPPDVTIAPSVDAGADASDVIGVPIVLADQLRGPRSLVTDGERAYVFEQSSNTIYAVSELGGSVVTLASPANGLVSLIQSLVYDDGHLYFTTNYLPGPPAQSGIGRIATTSTGGVSTETVVGEPYAATLFGLAIGGGSLVWGLTTSLGPTANAVRTRPLAGGAVTDLDLDHGAATIRLQGETAYWTGLPSGIATAAVPDGTTETLFADPVTDLAVDATDVFFTSVAGLQKMPRNGGTIVTLADAGSSRIALDATYVYVADTTYGRIVRVPKAGGPVVVLATGQIQPIGIVVESSRVVWVNQGTKSDASWNTDGSVMSLTTP